jgi:hypothetical protein
LVLSGSQVEKPQSLAAKQVLVWVQEYQCRIEQARLNHQLIKAQQYPDEAEEGQGEHEIPDANSNLDQRHLSELAQQVVHMVQACNEENKFLEEEFESVE